MTFAYSTRSVKSMPADIRDKIINCGIPIEIYTKGYVELGPANNSALKRLANIASSIYKNDLTIPPSPMIEYIAQRTGGKSKLDFTMTLGGKKGTGKSVSSISMDCRYALVMAELYGQDPKDYFTLDNCVLLEDTERVIQLMDEADKYQAILIDDASTAASNRDALTRSNKNLNKINTVSRTKRWFTTYNMPVRTHVDLQIRELSDASSRIYGSYHEGGFNILKINSADIIEYKGKNEPRTRRYAFNDRKYDFWVAYTPEVFDQFKGIVERYDKQRDEAAIRLIHDTATGKKRTRQLTMREIKRNEMFDKFYTRVQKLSMEGKSKRAIVRAIGYPMNEYWVDILLHGGDNNA